MDATEDPAGDDVANRSWSSQLKHHQEQGEQGSGRVGRSQRQVKTPNRLDLDEKVYSSTLDWKPMPGAGKPLGRIKYINENMKQFKSAKDPFLKEIHILLYNRPGREKFRKRDILRFSGFNEANDTAKRKDNIFRASKTSLKQLRRITHLFGLRTTGDKGELVNLLVDFLEKPYGDGYKDHDDDIKTEIQENDYLLEDADEEEDADHGAAHLLDNLSSNQAKKRKREEPPMNTNIVNTSLVPLITAVSSVSGDPPARKRLKTEPEEMPAPPIPELPSILSHSKKKAAPFALAPAPVQPALAPLPPPPPLPVPNKGRPKKSAAAIPKEPPPSPKEHARERRMIKDALEQFVRGIAGKAGYRLKSDVLIGYVYGVLGMKFARDHMELIATCVAEYLGR